MGRGVCSAPGRARNLGWSRSHLPLSACLRTLTRRAIRQAEGAMELARVVTLFSLLPVLQGSPSALPSNLTNARATGLDSGRTNIRVGGGTAGGRAWVWQETERERIM